MNNLGDSKSGQFDKAKKYLEQMREKETTASKRSLILLALLAVVWLGGLEPAISEIHELETIPTQIENLQSKLTIQEQQKEKVEKKIDIKANKRESENQDNTTLKPEIRKANQEKEKTRITQKIKDLQITIEQLQKNGDNISFDSPLFKLVVSINLAPWIWLTLISGWFYYIAFTRSEMLFLYARAIESCNLKNSNPLDFYTKETLAQIVGVLPFWLAPLPHLQNESNQNEIFEMRNSQGLSILLIGQMAPTSPNR